MTASVPASTPTPTLVVLGPPRHGVTLLARQVAEVLAAADAAVEVVAAETLAGARAALLSRPPGRAHLHLTDNLLAPRTEGAAQAWTDAARALREAGWELTLTLHDVPQPADGEGRYERRSATYRAFVAASHGVICNSWHESALLDALEAPARPRDVIPLPLIDVPGVGGAGGADVEGSTADDTLGTLTVGVLGFVYPGKGHAEVIEAAGVAACGLGQPVEVVALGAASDGHEGLVDDLAERAREVGVTFRATGYLSEEDLVREAREVDVPVAAHRHISASGSVNSWVAAGRRPLVTRGDYTTELSRRWAAADGTSGLVLVEPGAAALADAVRAALEDPLTTWLEGLPSHAQAPGLGDVADLYCEAWERWATDPDRWDLADEPHAKVVAGTDVSVVIPYYDDQTGLDRVLIALGRSTHPHASLEVVVADDGSWQPPSLDALPATIDRTLVRQADLGFRAAAARNLGARAARGDVLLFLDSDTAPEPDYVTTMTRAVLAHEGTLAVGRRRYVDVASGEEIEAPTWLDDAYGASEDLLWADARSYRYVISAVLGCAAADFAEWGGFDESFTGYGGEDWELASRAWNHGATLRHVPGAVAWHDGPDWGGRGEATADARVRARRVKNLETLRLAGVLPDPAARFGHVVSAVPVTVAMCVIDEATPAWAVCVASLLACPGVHVWLHGPGRETVRQWFDADPRVRLGTEDVELRADQVSPVPPPGARTGRDRVATWQPFEFTPDGLADLCHRASLLRVDRVGVADAPAGSRLQWLSERGLVQSRTRVAELRPGPVGIAPAPDESDREQPLDLERRLGGW